MHDQSGVIVHPTAIVDPAARLARRVEVGPGAVIEACARIGERTRIGPHAFVAGCCQIGADCEIDVAAALGRPAQIRGAAGEGGGVRIGDRCRIREHATVHRARDAGSWTTLGDDVFLMAGAHVAHDCSIGEAVTIASGALLAGFVTVQRRAFISGNVVVHQFERIGELSMIAGGALINRDVPPFMVVALRATAYAVNIIGMRRAGIPPDRRRVIQEAFRLLYRSKLNVSQAVERFSTLPATPELEVLTEFIASSKRGICTGPDRATRRAREGDSIG